MANRIMLNETSYHGAGAIEEIANEAKAHDFKKAFVCSDPDLIKFGVTKKVTDVLDKNGLAYEIYSDIKANPTIENVQHGVEAFKKSGADYLIAIGGGSSMDTSKAIGIIIANPEFEDVRSLEGVAPTKKPCVPIIAVPTTAGTAAEVTINYVITDVERKRKFVCVDPHDMPIIAIVDPDMMSSMPKGLTASTGMDALTHAIEGYTMLLQGEELSPDQEEYVEKILFNTQRLSGLVGNILLLSKLENQNIPMKKTEYRLDEQIRQAFLSLETKWTEKEIGFQVELEEVKYTGNEGLFMHIWINLLDNAIKFSPSKGTITMFLKQEQDSVKFILEDEGPGIEDDVKSRIFDKFYQVDGSHKAEGNGLGLALVKRIVDSAGGTIKAENREYGGCRFVIELPKQKDEII